MPDVSTEIAMHGHVCETWAWALRLTGAKDREEEKMIMQRILDAAVAYMVLAAGERDDG
jgi:hypothetical protein